MLEPDFTIKLSNQYQSQNARPNCNSELVGNKGIFIYIYIYVCVHIGFRV